MTTRRAVIHRSDALPLTRIERSLRSISPATADAGDDMISLAHEAHRATAHSSRAAWATVRRALAAATAAAAASILPVTTLLAQDVAETTNSSLDRWVEIGIVVALVAVLALLQWMGRPARSETGSFAKMTGADPAGDPDFRLSRYSSGVMVMRKKPEDPRDDDIA